MCLKSSESTMSTAPTSSDIPADPVQRNEWIKYQLRLRGSSLSKLARRLGVTRQAVRNALSSPYPKMERAIAAELELRPEDIWPERYAGRGNPDSPDGT